MKLHRPFHPALFLSLPDQPTNNNQPATLSATGFSFHALSALYFAFTCDFFLCFSLLYLYFLTSTTVFALRFLLNGFLTGEAFLWSACERKASLSHQSQRKKHVLFKK